MTTFNAGAIEARLTLSRTSFTAELRKARAQADTFSKKRITPTVDLNLEGFAEAEAAIAAMDAASINVPVDVDAGAAMTELSAFDAELELLDGREINLNVDVDMGMAEAELATLEAEVSALDGRDIDIDVDRDGSLGNSLSGLVGSGGGGGGSMGLLQALIVALIALSPIVSVAISALSAAVLALSSALVGAAGALGIIALAAFGAYKEFKRFKDAGRELTPEMQFFAGALDAIKDAWREFVKLTDNDVFMVMGIGLHILADALPTLARAVGPISDVLITMMNGISDWINSPGFVKFVDFFARFGAKALGLFGHILGDLFKIMMRVFRAIGPFAIEMLSGMADAMDGWVHALGDLKHNQGFQEWLDHARQYGPMVLDLLGSVWSALMNIADALRPFAGPMLAGLTMLFDIIADADPHVLTIIIGVLASLWAILSVGIPLIEGIVTALTLILSPAVAIVAAILGIAAILVYLYNTNKRFHDQVIDLWNSIYATVAPIVSDIVSYIMDHWDEISAYLEGLWKDIQGTINAALYDISGLIERWLDVVNFIWGHWGDQILKVVGVVFKIAGDMVKGALQVIKGIFEVMGGILHGDWSKVWKGIQDILGGAIKGMTAVIRGFGPLIIDLIRNAMSSLGGIVIEKVDDIVQAVRDLPGKIRSVGGSMLSAGEHIIGQFVEGLKNIGVIGGLAGDVFSAITGALHDVLGYIITQLNEAIPNTLSISHAPDIDLPDNPIPGGLAEGGVATRPTLSWIAEAGEPEAVVPLSRLDSWIDKVAGSGIDYNKLQQAFAQALMNIIGEDGLAPHITIPQTINNPVAEPASMAGQNALATLATVGIGS